MVASVKVELVLGVARDRAWKAFKESNVWLPKRRPNVVKSYEYLNGERGPGSLRLITYGSDFPAGSFSLQKILAEDNDSLSSTYTIVGGTVASRYKHYMGTVDFMPGPFESTTLASWSLEYECTSSDHDSASLQAALTRSILDAFKALEEYSLS